MGVALNCQHLLLSLPIAYCFSIDVDQVSFQVKQAFHHHVLAKIYLELFEDSLRLRREVIELLNHQPSPLKA